MKKFFLIFISLIIFYNLSFSEEIKQLEKQKVISEGSMFGLKRSVSYVDFFVSYNGKLYFCSSKFVRRYNIKKSQNITKCFDDN